MKKRLVYVSLVLIVVSGCSSVSKGLSTGGDEIVKVVSKVDPPPVAVSNAVPKAAVPKAAAAISSFIKQAGKAKGREYIRQQVSSNRPVSKQTLSDVIYAEIVSEILKTGQQVVKQEVREFARSEAIALINEYNSENNNNAKVTQ